MTGVGGDPLPEVEVDRELVRALLREQHPDLAERLIVDAGGGWDNVIYRLGDDLAVRLPRREVAAPLIEVEQRWLPGLAARLPLPVPAPVRTGRPGCGYPWAWSVTPWFAGRPALETPPTHLGAAAVTLGEFVRALHEPAPPDAPPNPYRGVPLGDRSPLVDRALDHLEPDSADGIDLDRVRDCWEKHRDLPPWDGPPVWLHGDLHPLNLIVAGGRISAVIDFGDLTSGDPSTDLFIAWMLLPPEHREAFRLAAGATDETQWRRGRGWALCMGLAYLASTSPANVLGPLGRQTLVAVLADWEHVS